MGNGGEVTADQFEHLIEKLGEVVTRLDALAAELRSDYVPNRVHVLELALLENKIVDNQKDIDATRATLGKVVFFVIGVLGSIIVGVVTALVLGVMQP